MTWAARIQPGPEGLRLRFDAPVRVLDMTPETARRFAALILMAAEQRQPRPLDQEVTVDG